MDTDLIALLRECIANEVEMYPAEQFEKISMGSEMKNRTIDEVDSTTYGAAESYSETSFNYGISAESFANDVLMNTEQGIKNNQTDHVESIATPINLDEELRKAKNVCETSNTVRHTKDYKDPLTWLQRQDGLALPFQNTENDLISCKEQIDKVSSQAALIYSEMASWAVDDNSSLEDCPEINSTLNHTSSMTKINKQTALKCTDCNRVFRTNSSLTQHRQAHHLGPRIHKCKQCTRRFVTSEQLQRHVVSHDPTVKKQFACSMCPKAYRKKADLERHFDSHHGNPKFICQRCGMKFVRMDHFDRHLGTHANSNT